VWEVKEISRFYDQKNPSLIMNLGVSIRCRRKSQRRRCIGCCENISRPQVYKRQISQPNGRLLYRNKLLYEMYSSRRQWGVQILSSFGAIVIDARSTEALLVTQTEDWHLPSPDSTLWSWCCDTWTLIHRRHDDDALCFSLWFSDGLSAWKLRAIFQAKMHKITIHRRTCSRHTCIHVTTL